MKTVTSPRVFALWDAYNGRLDFFGPRFASPDAARHAAKRRGTRYVHVELVRRAYRTDTGGTATCQAVH